MSITTKSGDDGLTTWRRVRVPKTSPEIKFLGFLDLTMAQIAMAQNQLYALHSESFVVPALQRINKIMSDVAAVLAADALRDLCTEIIWCDKMIMAHDVELDEFVDFSKTSQVACQINVARATLRLAESHLPSSSDDQDPLVRPLMNRLSDLLFLLALNC